MQAIMQQPLCDTLLEKRQKMIEEQAAEQERINKLQAQVKENILRINRAINVLTEKIGKLSDCQTLS